MRIVLHLLRTDCAALRAWLIGWALLNVASFAAQLLPAPDLREWFDSGPSRPREWFDSGPWRPPHGINVSSPDTVAFVLMAVMAMLTVWRVIHLDPLGNPRAFWPTRPPGPLRLLAAKVLFVTLWLFALPGLLQGLAFACAGFEKWAVAAWCDWFFVQSALVGAACAVGTLTNGPRLAILASVLSTGGVVWLQAWLGGQRPWTLLEGQAGPEGGSRFAVALLILALGGLVISVGRYCRRHQRSWYGAAVAMALALAAVAHPRWPGKLALLNRPRQAHAEGPALSLAWRGWTNRWSRLGTESVGGARWLSYTRWLRADASTGEPPGWAGLRPDWSLSFADGSNRLPHRSGRVDREALFYSVSDHALKAHLSLPTRTDHADPWIPFFTEPQAAVAEMQERRVVLSGILEVGGLANPIIQEIPLKDGAGFRHGPFRWRIDKVLRGNGDLAFQVLGEEPMWQALGTPPSWHGPCTDAYRYRPYLWNESSRKLAALCWGRRADQIDPGRRKRFYADRYSLLGYGYQRDEEPVRSAEAKEFTRSLDVEGTVLIFVEWEVVKWADLPFQTRPFGPLDKEELADEPVANP